jgi:MATE family multidrug resistance protein
MKKHLLAHYFSGLSNSTRGEKYGRILGYFFPEFITALALYSLLYLLDARWVADLKSTYAYATLGATNTLIHLIIKITEGLSVGTVILCGHFNGLKQYSDVGKTLRDSFWVSVIVGGLIAAFLYFGAHWIYVMYGVPPKMIALGIPYLRLRAISIFFMVVFFAIIGFLRGIKNTKTPMYFFVVGGAVFLFFDYALIFGVWGFPALRLQGSALASVLQYGVMMVIAIVYLFASNDTKKYSISLFEGMTDWRRIKELIVLSWPVMIDKAIFAAAYLWLGAMINPMGKYAIASYTVIKDLERLAILPAAAFAQVITFLVSNAYGQRDWEGIKCTIKKVLLLAAIFVFAILLLFSLNPSFFIQVFDQKGKFTDFSARIFPILSILVFFDLLQLILSGALRGAADVKIVMWTRLIVGFGYFVPVSWFLAHLPIEDQMLKFFLVYASFYIGSGLMGIVYIWRLRGEQWKKTVL